MFIIVFVVMKNTSISLLYLSPKKASLCFIYFCPEALKYIPLKIFFVCYRLQLMYQTSSMTLFKPIRN